MTDQTAIQNQNFNSSLDMAFEPYADQLKGLKSMDIRDIQISILDGLADANAATVRLGNLVHIALEKLPDSTNADTARSVLEALLLVQRTDAEKLDRLSGEVLCLMQRFNERRKPALTLTR